MNRAHRYIIKNKNIRISILIFFILISFNFKIISDWTNISSADASQEILEINQRILKNTCYSFKIIYKSFNGHSNYEPYEQKKGIVIRDGINYKSDALGKLVVQNKKFRITIDTATKIIMVSNPLNGNDPDLNPQDYIKAMGSCKTVKKSKDNELTGFRFEMKSTRGVVSQEIFFSNEFIKKITYYYVNEHTIRENNTTKEEILYPKITISINDFKLNEKMNLDLFSTDKIIETEKGKLKVSSAYKNYKLIDGRYYK